MFRRAAYYDSQAVNQPFQSIKEGGNRNQTGLNPSEFKKHITGDKSQNQSKNEEGHVTSQSQ